MNQIQIINHNGQRVLTTVQLAESYGADRQQISYNFNHNKNRYEEGKHFIALYGEAKREFINRHEIHDSLKNAAILYLWTEKGAWMHAKSLNTDQAWEAYEMLVDDYYTIKQADPLTQLSPELKAILLLDKRTQAFETRVERLENNTTIDYGQQNDLQQLANKSVVSLLGGKDSPAYTNKTIRSETYSALWRDFKGYFNTNSYKNTLVKDFDKAREYVHDWSPHGKLLRDIEQANAQISFQ
ncbi:ORF6C domain-containing protein [Paenibacillus lautus]|uniref:ORF6C domain-containing protein n=1 Tax=Paenibacillus lautus TaxID=1401 RepID=UPI003D2DA6BD